MPQMTDPRDADALALVQASKDRLIVHGGAARGVKARDEQAVEPLTESLAAHVLVAEDDLEMRRFLVESLIEEGYRVTEVSDGEQLRRRLIGPHETAPISAPDIVVSDIYLPGFTGLELLEELRNADWSLPVVLITAFGDESIHREGKRLGAAKVFDKPFDIDDLINTLKTLVPP